MRDFTYYTEKAISRYGLAGQNALAAEIGINKSAMSQLATGRTLPSEARTAKRRSINRPQFMAVKK